MCFSLVYERYIQKGNKKIGPYYYENVRHEGKVKTVYIGRNPQRSPKHKIKKPLFVLIVLFILILAIGSSIFFLKNRAYSVYKSQQADAPDFSVDQLLLKVLVKSKDYSVKQIRIMDTGEDAINISMESRNMLDIINIDSSLFTIKRGQTKIINLNFSSFVYGQNVEHNPGVYVGKLIVKSGKGSKEIPIIVEIESKDVLFDTNLNPISVDRKINAGSDVTIDVRLFNLQSIEAVNVDMEYFVKDVDGNTIITESETVVVKTQASFFKTISIPKKLKPGTYVFISEAKFGNSVGTSSYIFEVAGDEAQKSSGSFIQLCKEDAMCIGLSVVALLLLFSITAYFYFYVGAYLYDKVAEVFDVYLKGSRNRRLDKKKEKLRRKKEELLLRKQMDNLEEEKRKAEEERKSNLLKQKEAEKKRKDEERKRKKQEPGRIKVFLTNLSKSYKENKKKRLAEKHKLILQRKKLEEEKRKLEEARQKLAEEQRQREEQEKINRHLEEEKRKDEERKRIQKQKESEKERRKKAPSKLKVLFAGIKGKIKAYNKRREFNKHKSELRRKKELEQKGIERQRNLEESSAREEERRRIAEENRKKEEIEKKKFILRKENERIKLRKSAELRRQSRKKLILGKLKRVGVFFSSGVKNVKSRFRRASDKRRKPAKTKQERLSREVSAGITKKSTVDKENIKISEKKQNPLSSFVESLKGKIKESRERREKERQRKLAEIKKTKEDELRFRRALEKQKQAEEIGRQKEIERQQDIEEKRIKKEEQEKIIEETKRQKEIEKQRILEEKKRKEELEKQKLLEEKRQKEELKKQKDIEKQRILEEKKRKEEIEKQRIIEEKLRMKQELAAQKESEKQRILEESRARGEERRRILEEKELARIEKERQKKLEEQKRNEEKQRILEEEKRKEEIEKQRIIEEKLRMKQELAAQKESEKQRNLEEKRQKEELKKQKDIEKQRILEEEKRKEEIEKQRIIEEKHLQKEELKRQKDIEKQRRLEQIKLREEEIKRKNEEKQKLLEEKKKEKEELRNRKQLEEEEKERKKKQEELEGKLLSVESRIAFINSQISKSRDALHKFKNDAENSGKIIHSLEDSKNRKGIEIEELKSKRSALLGEYKARTDEWSRDFAKFKEESLIRKKEFKSHLLDEEAKLFKDAMEEVKGASSNKNDIKRLKKVEIDARLKIEEKQFESAEKSAEKNTLKEKSSISSDYRKKLGIIESQIESASKELSNIGSQINEQRKTNPNIHKIRKSREEHIAELEKKLQRLEAKKSELEPLISASSKGKNILGKLFSKMQSGFSGKEDKDNTDYEQDEKSERAKKALQFEDISEDSEEFAGSTELKKCAEETGKGMESALNEDKEKAKQHYSSAIKLYSKLNDKEKAKAYGKIKSLYNLLKSE